MTVTKRDEYPWQARIRDSRGRITGAGVVVSAQHILTCAHVITNAVDVTSDVGVGTEVVIDLPGFGRIGRRRAYVPENGWFPIEDSGAGDIALLELDEPLDGVPAARLMVPDIYSDRRVRVCGYPDGADLGVWSRAILSPRNEAGWVQLDDDRAGGTGISRGFSGAGVVDDKTDAVTGIVVAELGDRSAKVAWMLPMDVIAECWPPLADRVEGAGGIVSISPLGFSAVSECGTPDGGHEITALAQTGGLVHRWWDAESGWSHWHEVKLETPAADIATSRYGRNGMARVVADIHGRLWRSSAHKGQWHSWHRMGPIDVTASPAVARVAAASKREGHQEIFAVTGAGEVIHRSSNHPGSWSDWQVMDLPVPARDVAATSASEGHLACAATDIYGRLWWRNNTDGDWDDWHKMRLPGTDNPRLTAVAATSGWPNHLEVFAVTGSGELVHRWWWPTEPWSKWHVKDSPVPVADVAATSNTSGHIECVITSTDGILLQQYFDATSQQWSSFDKIHDLLWRGSNR